VGLSNGDKLVYEEMLFFENSTQDTPLATCLEHHKDVISTVALYNEFTEDCDYVTDSRYDADFFSENVLVLMFFDGPSSNKPKTFYDYLFMIEDHEVIQVRYHNPLFGMTKDGTQYIYFITMRKNQIDSADILFT